MINLFNKKPIEEIPVFFATDDNYIPFLDVSVRSLIENASKKFNYRIIVLNTGLQKESVFKIKELEDDNFKIDFYDISPYFDEIKDKLRNVFHFGLATYYRLFIERLFPQYKKAVYLDCDLVVLGDISELYFTDMGDNLLAGSIERYVASTPEFRNYTQVVLGIDCMKYVNAGVLLMNLEKIREAEIERQFLEILNEYNFKSIAPDQDYLNFLCKDRILLLPSGWNKTPLSSVPVEGKLNIVHYALVKKPWQYDDVLYGEYFWQYAEKSPFYRDIVLKKQNFSEEDKAKKEKANIDIVELANEISASDHTFYKKLVLQTC